jgi:hypothetical protein
LKKKITITTFEQEAEDQLDYMLSLSFKERLDLLELARRKAYGKAYLNYKRPQPAKPVIIISTQKK